MNNIINEFTKNSAFQDIENSNSIMPDYNQLSKIERRKNLSIIENLHKNCTINTDFDKTQKELEEYTKNYINTNFPFTLDTTLFFYNSKTQEEVVNLINPQIQGFIRYVNLLGILYYYIQEKYVKKDKDNIELNFFHNFNEYSIQLLNSVSSLLLREKNNNVISLYRTIYENYILYFYINKHKELIHPFLDHSLITELSLKKQLAKVKKINLSNEINEEYKKIISKHDEKFADDYGWAYKTIPDPKNRKLVTMYKESDLNNDYEYLYKLACEYSHLTSFSLLVRPELKDLNVFLTGIVDIISKELNIYIDMIKFKSTKEKELIKKWLLVCSKDLITNIKKVF